MMSAGCARGISFLSALHTVRAHGEYNYRLIFVLCCVLSVVRAETDDYLWDKLSIDNINQLHTLNCIIMDSTIPVCWSVV